jgi:glutamine amidotransferase
MQSDMFTIVDYKAGNLASVRLAVEKLGFQARVSDQPEEIAGAERLIFPGVGAAGAAMQVLKRTGIGDAIVQFAATGRPLAGLCLGAQIIFEHSAEDDADCLGLLKGRVVPLQVSPGLKVPHMGWNGVEFVAAHPVWSGLESGAQFYFVHSYVPVPEKPEVVIGTTEYGARFASAVAQGNIVAFQFHPERSGRAGLEVLENFLRWKP